MKLSICVPYHETVKTPAFLSRLMTSLAKQTFQDYEVVLTKEGKMGENHNAAAIKAQGELIHFMGMDDYFAHPDALKSIVESMEEKEWGICGCLHFDGQVEGYPHQPVWNDHIWDGTNTLGNISTLTVRRDAALFFDMGLDWMIDVDYYWRMYQKYGLPVLLDDYAVVVHWHPGQTTNQLTDAQKKTEAQIMHDRYGH